MADGPGLLGSVAPNYTYSNTLGAPQQQTPKILTPTAGMASIASALINGYFNPNQQSQQAGQNVPMNLQGAQNPGLLGWIQNQINQPTAADWDAIVTVSPRSIRGGGLLMADPSSILDQAASFAPNFINPAYSTPEQRKQLYAYAQELIKPQPVHRATQGIANIVSALIGGYAGGQTDRAEQGAVQEAARQLVPFGGIVSPGGGATGAASPLGGTGSVSTAQPEIDPTTPYGATVASARKYGIDPAVATKVFGVESGFNPGATGDKNATGQPTSFNVPQLHYTGDPRHPAMGDQFTAETGLDARKPENSAAAIDYALRRASKEGWGAWATTRDKLGISNYTGIGTAPAPAQSTVAPGAAQPPIQVAQAGPGNGFPVSPAQFGAVMANPNISPETKRMAMELVKPQMFETATGQVVPSYQYKPVGSPIANKGILRDQTPGSVPAIVEGPVNKPTNTVVPPVVAPSQPAAGPAARPGVSLPSAPAAGASLAQIFGPSGLGQMARGQAETKAVTDTIAAKASANQQRFQKTQDQGPALVAEAYPLRQAQAILERNGGVLPTGEGAQNVMGHASLVNMVSTWLGHPLTDEDSRLTSLQLLNKYGRQIADAQASNLTGHPTNMQTENAAHTSPNSELSAPANMHLIDNLIRLNQLAQKKAKFEHDYYLKNSDHPENAYDNFNEDWLKEIGGTVETRTKAIPLSKYGRKVTRKDGSPGIYVPSTDPDGFTLYPADSGEFQPSVMMPEKK